MPRPDGTPTLAEKVAADEYAEANLNVRKWVLGGGFPGATAWLCDTCGAAVIDPGKHFAWHEGGLRG